MLKIKEGPRLVINSLVVYQLFSDPTFVNKVPVFYGLKAMAAAIITGQACGTCGTQHARMMPLVEAFGKLVIGLHRDSPAALVPLVQYIEERRGHRPTPILMYHKEDGEIKAVTL